MDNKRDDQPFGDDRLFPTVDLIASNLLTSSGRNRT